MFLHSYHLHHILHFHHHYHLCHLHHWFLHIQHHYLNLFQYHCLYQYSYHLQQKCFDHQCLMIFFFYVFSSWLLFTLNMRFLIAAASSTTYLRHFHAVLLNTWTVFTLPLWHFQHICIHLLDAWRIHPWLGLVILFIHTWISIYNNYKYILISFFYSYMNIYIKSDIPTFVRRKL